MTRLGPIAVISAGILLSSGCRGGGNPEAASSFSQPIPADPQRIVAMAPSLTEILFALGLGERVVGRTRFCSHPAEVRSLPEVGGYLDPNYEALVALQPDLVVLMQSHSEAERRLSSFGVPVILVDQHDIQGVMDSVTTIAEACGVSEEGVSLRDSISRRIQSVEKKVVSVPHPRVVVVVGHEADGGVVRSVWAAGPDTFYDDVLRFAGGLNAVDAGVARYPELGREGLAVLDPDIVIDVVAGLEERGLNLEKIRTSWRVLTELRAVRLNRVHVLIGDDMVVPGPRIPNLVEEFARSLHPDLDWDPR